MFNLETMCKVHVKAFPISKKLRLQVTGPFASLKGQASSETHMAKIQEITHLCALSVTELPLPPIGLWKLSSQRPLGFERMGFKQEEND